MISGACHQVTFYSDFKGGLSLKTKYWHIHLYFIATKYLWNNALVEYIDNWNRSYSLVTIYWICYMLCDKIEIKISYVIKFDINTSQVVLNQLFLWHKTLLDNLNFKRKSTQYSKEDLLHTSLFKHWPQILKHTVVGFKSRKYIWYSHKSGIFSHLIWTSVFCDYFIRIS